MSLVSALGLAGHPKEGNVMRRNHRLMTLILAGAMLIGTVASSPSWAIKLGDVLKGGGIVILVNQFGDELNKVINKVTLNKGVSVKDRTKVVPIVSLGQGGFVGAAQVSGPAHLVNKVKAVAQIESKFNSFRIKALVPIESKEIVKNMKRVGGVGVSAIIDAEL